MRESMEFDVVIVGAGPSGLSTAIRLKQLNAELNVCVLEKGSEVGAHILSGAVLEPRALNELFENWQDLGAPLNTPVTKDEVYVLKNGEVSKEIPHALVPNSMKNDGNYIVSVGNLSRWLAEQAEGLGVEIFPGFAAAEILYHEDGRVKGVATGDMGISASGEQLSTYMEGMELHATYTVLSEGCRGHLGKQLIQKFSLDANADPQHYALGIKELWQIDPAKHQPGLVVHGAGWPLDDASGGFFLYHTDNNQVVAGLIVDLNYRNPWLSPYEEFQRLKHHPVFKQYLEGGERVSYGARAITKGGWNALPTMTMPGAMLVGCDAGTLNVAKIKGTHTAMKSGMLAAEAISQVLADDSLSLGETFSDSFDQSWLKQELYSTRNFAPAMHKFGTVLGGAFNYVDQNILGGKMPITLHDTSVDHAQMQTIAQAKKIDYPKPDGKLSFDRLSSVFLSNTNHEEDQPCHLTLADDSIPTGSNLSQFAEPAQRYCPAGVYEIVEQASGPTFQINAQNCLHCKTCDIKDPAQNITWVTPEGTGGPNYPNM
ncbi:Electron transfer flavoprotein-ubiquinone oxidoreductase [Marinomonas gallaica]|uniref:Electron transfer flavoprotein-ubiquinone oxidoreductase n=1 Tax=Marinomonas gallaica TaxID=1806667 RepID=A0A1C3JNK0_9GAMM|nr:electron transfer flavoprotein-ubiquinone oxidoreductase [Marinomonas gallaica]SBT16637.1 Electron transfer flavoprotein-ubiquinone oxidoreductase [Marinomonas gallaica]SBT20353.1 Electron transfer flavoprotein-ubiquinone oxidoreductase [Marinomonas gallaica]